MSESPTYPVWHREPQFDILPVINNHDELARRMSAAESVATLGVRGRTWRVPTRQLLLSRLESLTGTEPAYLAHMGTSTDDFLALIAATRENLKDFPATHRPFLPRFTRQLAKYDDLPEDQIAVIGGLESLSFKRSDPRRPQGLPFGRREDFVRVPLSAMWLGSNIANAIDFNFPHPLEAQCGTWRDWILGMKVMLADGTIVNTGSRAVKNVAGYDLHKLLIGARGTLGMILEVTIRTTPYDSLPKPELEFRYEQPPFTEGWRLRQNLWVQRTRPSDFTDAVRLAGDAVLEIDWASNTLWATVPPDQELARFEGDWILRSGCGKKNLEFTDPTQIALMRRAKELFDPTHKLNPGEMGIF